MYDFAKHGLLPGSPGLLLVGLCAALVAARFRRTGRKGRTAAALLVVVYWALSTPGFAWMLERIVAAGYEPVGSAVQLDGVRAIVVLDAATNRYDGGDGIHIATLNRSSAVRALETVRLYRMISPSVVVVTAGSRERTGGAREGEALRESLERAGIPSARLLLESSSSSTSEHPANVAPMLKQRGIDRFALVTSAVHMPRAMRAFEREGMGAYPAPAALDPPGRYPWWPSTGGMDRSMEVMHEIFGLARDFVVRHPA